MKRLILLLAIFATLGVAKQSKAQSIGFSYFFPTNGYFSNPIAPIHLNFPLKFGKFLQITPGISMNSIGGMSMSKLPDELNSNRALIGPFQSFNMNLIPTIIIPGKGAELEIMGGAFGFAAINQKLMIGNFEDMLSEAFNYSTLSSDLSLNAKAFGWGFVYGIKINIKLKDNIWGYIAGRYYLGYQSTPISGDIIHTKNYEIPQHSTINYADARMNYHGFEITIGGSMRKKK